MEASKSAEQKRKETICSSSMAAACVYNYKEQLRSSNSTLNLTFTLKVANENPNKVFKHVFEKTQNHGSFRSNTSNRGLGSRSCPQLRGQSVGRRFRHFGGRRRGGSMVANYEKTC